MDDATALQALAQRAQRACEEAAALGAHARAALDADSSDSAAAAQNSDVAAWRERLEAFTRSATIAAETAAVEIDAALERVASASASAPPLPLLPLALLFLARKLRRCSPRARAFAAGCTRSRCEKTRVAFCSHPIPMAQNLNAQRAAPTCSRRRLATATRTLFGCSCAPRIQHDTRARACGTRLQTATPQSCKFCSRTGARIPPRPLARAYALPQKEIKLRLLKCS
jgi:hypothetical protein